MKPGRILHLPSVVALIFKSFLVVPVFGPYELGILLQVAASGKNMIVIVTDRTVNTAVQKVESDVWPFVNGAEPNGLSTYTRISVIERKCSLDVDGVPV